MAETPLAVSPNLVKILDYIYRRGLDKPGILLLRGNEQEVLAIKRAMLEEDTLCTHDFNIHSVCALLIMHINSIPPIVPTRVTDACVKLSHTEICSYLTHALPPANFNTFYYVLSFLREVLAHSRMNGLDATQLGPPHRN